jgi:uncharacterized membrane protein
MHAARRLLRHLFTTSAAGRRSFPAHTLKAIQSAIAEGERSHRAEVRMIIEAAMPLADVLQGMHARVRARELFARYRIWDTEENCGVLVYVNLADRKVEIVADRASGRALSREEWQSVCRTITDGFARGQFHDSAVAGLEQLNGLLARQFPEDGRQPNQLPDRPLVM